MIFYSHCKINIGLRVVSRRDDGFHDIESLFYPVKGVSDAVEIVRSEGSGVEFSSSGIVVDCPADKNLCVRAYNIMQERYNLPAVKMHLHKSIPMGAGLGGGSANCAATIKGLNTLFDLELDSPTMQSIGAELGSDVPFFIDEQPSWVSGRGEQIEPSDISLEGMSLVIVKPNIHIGTAWAYSKIEPKRGRTTLKAMAETPLERWRDFVDNDFEKPVFEAHPEIESIKQSLYASGATFALMSGSGASVYGIFKNDVPKELYFGSELFVVQMVM